MASEFVKRMAEQSRRRVDQQNGATRYGGSSHTYQPAAQTVTPLERLAGEMASVPKINPMNPVSRAALEAYVSRNAARKGAQWTETGQIGVLPDVVADRKAVGLRDLAGFAKDNTMPGLHQFNSGLAKTADMFLPDYLTPKPVQNALDYYKDTAKQSAEDAARRNQARFGDAGVLAGEFYQSTVAALPQAAEAFLTGGASAAMDGTGALIQAGKPLFERAVAGLLRNPSFWTSFAQTVGSDYEEAKENGANELQARAAAVSGSLINAVIETGGGVEEMARAGGSGLRDVLKSAAGEGLEEVEQGMVSGAANKAVFDHGKKLASLRDEGAVISPKRAVKEFAGGAIAGGVLSAGGAAVNYALGVNGQKNYATLKERDGGRTPDFDRQHEHYYQAGRSGTKEGQVRTLPSATPIGQAAAQSAYYAGQNDAKAEAAETIKTFFAGKAVSDTALDRALSLPESRAEIEKQTGKLPETPSQARKAAREWRSKLVEETTGTMLKLFEGAQEVSDAELDRALGFQGARAKLEQIAGTLPEDRAAAREAVRRAVAERQRAAAQKTESAEISAAASRDAQKAADGFLRSYESKADKAEIRARFQNLYGHAENGAGTASLRAEAEGIARDILSRSERQANELSEQYQGLREELRSTKITLGEQDRLSLSDSYSDFRKKNFGRLRVVSEGGIPVDTMYEQLHSDYGDALFPADITHPAARLERMAEVLESLRPVTENPYSRDMDGAVKALTKEILQENRTTQARRNAAKANTPAETDGLRNAAPGLFETEVSRRMEAADREFLDTMLQAVGVRGAIVSQSSAVENAHIEGDVITIFADADDAAGAYRGTVKHEITHRIKALGAKSYQAFEDFAVEEQAKREGASADSLIQGIKSLYRERAGQELTDAQAREEIAGDFAMTLDLDAETVQRFTAQNQQAAKGILQTIRDIIRRIREKFTGRSLNREQREFLRQLGEGERLWAAALGEASQRAKENAARTDGGTRYSLKTDENGRKYVYVDVDQHLFDGLTTAEMQQRAKDIILERFRGKVIGSGENRAFVNKRTAEHYAYPANRRMPDSVKQDKMRTSTELDNIMEAAVFRENVIPDNGKHPEATRGLDKFDTIFEVGGRRYTAEITRLATDNGDIFYELSKFNDISERKVGQTPESAAASPEDAVDTSITDSEGEVKPQKRFSLKKPAEQTETLLALHNLTADKLRGALELGGFPMPSVAVVKSSEGHTNYGEISVVFPKNAIDPEANPLNHIYGGDAWTPTAPRLDYEADPKAETRISQRLDALSSGVDPFFRRDLRRAYQDLDGQMNEYGGEKGIAERALNNYGLKAAFLEEQGQHIAAQTVQKEVSKGYSPDRAEKYEAVLKVLGTTDAGEIGRLNLKQMREQHGAELEQAFPGMTKTALRMSSILSQIQAYRNRSGAGPSYETVTDSAATQRAVDAALDRPAYERWVQELFSGLEGKRGIYNGKDPFTAGGRQRSFDQLHYAYTLENLVKVMGQGQARGTGTWGANAKTLQSAAAPEYRSIDAAKADSGRLGTVDEAWYESVVQEIDGVLGTVMGDIRAKNPQSGYSLDGVAELVLDAARGRKTVDAITRVFRKEGLTISNDIAMRLQGLYKAAAELPTGYFEAKPQRAVGLTEALAVAVPDDVDAALVRELEKRGVQVLTYKSGDKSARLAAVNSVEDAKFSLKNSQEIAGRLARYIDQYGALPRGEQAVRDIMFPKRTTEDTRVRRFSRTAAESASLADGQAGAIGKAVAEGRFNYEPVGDKAARKYAESILSRGEKAAADAWNAVVSRTSPASKNDIALGEYLLREAAKAGDTERVVQLTAEIAAEGTRAGQVVQAMRLLKKLDGAGQLVSLDTMLKKLQGDLDKGKSGVFLKVSERLRQKLAGAKGETEVNAVLDEIYTELAAQMPSSWGDRWNAWRYLSMLGNPRTHIRNILGNAAFEPAVIVKNAVGAALERVFLPEGQRTKSISALLPGTGGGARQFAQADFKEMRDIITGGGKMNPSDIIRERQAVFKNRTLEWVRKQNFNFLEAEDGVFLEHHYVRAMTQYLKANHINIQALDTESKEGAKVLNHAREYAVKEAQKATYRDFSRTAQAISKASRDAPKAVGALIEGVLPFKKTPVNVLKRGVEYSPVGLAKALAYDLNRLRRGRISGSEFIDSVSAGLTGSGIAALGWLLTGCGVLAGGGGDDKEQEFRDALGAQSWALKCGDKTYTIDWLAPGAMPLFVGAEVRRLHETGVELSGRSVWDAALTIAEPMTQMSMLDGLNSMLSSVRYGTDPLSDMLAGAAADYINQAVPTLLGQAARTIDPVRRTTYDDKNSGVPSLVQKTVQKDQNKLPYLSRNSAAYLDLWGREQLGGSAAQRALQNFISPGYLRDEKLSAMESELIRLYQATGDGSALPGRAEKSFTVGEGGSKTTKYLTAAEYQAFAKARGALLYSGLSEITASSYYKGLDETGRLELVRNMGELANAVAKTGVSDYQIKDWYAKAVTAQEEYGIPFSTFVMAYSAQSGVEGIRVTVKGETDENGAPVTKALANSKGLRKMQAIYAVPGLNDKQRAYLFGEFAGKQIRHWNKAKVEQELQKMEREAAK